jgi:hypothetical protein
MKRSPHLRHLVLPLIGALAATPAARAHEGAEHVGRMAWLLQAVLSNNSVKTGSGDFTYATVPNWHEMPGPVVGPTHGSIVVDKQGLIYVSTETKGQSIIVFSPEGKILRKFDTEYVGMHGMCIHDEAGTQFIYAASPGGGRAIKFALGGKVVWTLEPDQIKKDSGKYQPDPNAPAPAPDKKKGKAGPVAPALRPTGIAVAPNGDVYLADGYGQSWVHQYDKNRRYIRSFGGKGAEPGKFNNCHGIALDSRGPKPLLLVSNREARRLDHYDLDGNFVAVVVEGLRRPCAVSIQGDHVAVAELEGRVTLLDKNNNIVAHLGDNPVQAQWANFKVDPKDWADGIFTAPHGLSFDKDHNLYVQDWNFSGRITRLNLLRK